MLHVIDGFRGNWHIPFIARRYANSFWKAATPGKLANVALAMTEMSFARPVVRSMPFMLRLEPVSLCNLRCPRCSTGLGIDPRPKGFLVLDDLDFILEQVKSHTLVVRFDGNGEPLLHPNITEAIARIRSAGISVDISSHFNTMPSGGPEAIVESGLNRLMVAVDGSTQEIYERYRAGGNLDRVLGNLQDVVDARNKRKGDLIVEVQFLNWGYNTHQIEDMRRLTREIGADRLTIIEPDAPTNKPLPQNPRRCFWLWAVMTVDWRLEYRSCTNAWTYPFPELNARRMPPSEFWNSPKLIEARRFNRNRASKIVAKDKGCMCNRCTDMLVVPRPAGYVCE